MLRLQKYLLPLESTVSLTGYYASAYAEIKLRNDTQFRQIAETVTRTNQKLAHELKRLREGDYDSMYTQKFNLKPCSPIRPELPYSTLTSIDLNTSTDPSVQIYNEYFKDREITPETLDTDGWWPVEFNSISARIRTSEYHVSLLPVIMFKTLQESTRFKHDIMHELANCHVSTIGITTTDKLKILPKYDFSKFFLGMCIDRDTNPVLSQLQRRLYGVRENIVASARDGAGYVCGEVNGRLIDWKESTLHMSIGVCNRGGHGCGQDELSFLNTVLDGSPQLQLEGKVVFVVNGEQLRCTDG